MGFEAAPRKDDAFLPEPASFACRNFDRRKQNAERTTQNKLTAGNRPACNGVWYVRSTRQGNRSLRKAHAEIGGRSQACARTHSARCRQQLPPLRAVSDFCEGWKRQQ